jgi:mannose-1-phosphate guanylyltransferase / mannose-6-phosphate isomerase
MKINSVILSGGAGTRLWPSSRQSFPKPFMKVGSSTLLEQTARRAYALNTDQLTVVTNKDYLFQSRVLLNAALGSKAESTQFILEPIGRNTAAAIALAAFDARERGQGSDLLLVLPADHLIPDSAAFATCAALALEQAALGKLCTFGVVPTAPETGYGYIEVASQLTQVQPVRCFVEKPSFDVACDYLASGRYFWNSGMFCFGAQTFLDALATHAKSVFDSAQACHQSSKYSSCVRNYDLDSVLKIPSISVDYAVMEKSSNVAVVPASFSWSDVGTWDSIAQVSALDVDGNSGEPQHLFVNSTKTFIQSSSRIVAAVGTNNLAIIDTPDALLVIDRARSQEVKLVVDKLKLLNRSEWDLPAVVNRPWGTYQSLQEESGYKVKRITVNPGQSLSLQFHHKRAEHWMVVQGTAQVQIGDTEYKTEPGQYRYIPLGEKHRLTNVGKDLLVLIEVQCGSYLGEDDIVRLQDNYGRADT